MGRVDVGRQFISTAMAERNPYDVLGVGKNASDGEIKRAFRKKARQYHPDRNQGDAASEAKFKEVQSAYDSISTPESRREHDQQEQMRNMFGGGRGGRGGMGGGFPGMGGQPRGQPQRPAQQPKAATINVGLDLSTEDAMGGGQFEISFNRFKKEGNSMETKRTTVNLRLEPGATHGTTKTLRGQGHDHPEGQRGDVVVTVRISMGEMCRWEGNQLVQDVPVPYSVLVMGGKVSVRLPSGKVGKLSVAANTEVGDRRRMSGAGYNGGDLTLEFSLIPVEALSDEQRSALETLRDLGL
ncbi:MAG: J domain-containing protein [Candidatus Poseidoniales archaeon]|nr:MAG: J domain-containing protein [Candidatus Poseidoniales archaeon]